MTNSYLYIYIDSHNTTNIEMDLRITNIDDAKCMIKSLSNYDILYIYINHKSDINDAILMIFLNEIMINNTITKLYISNYYCWDDYFSDDKIISKNIFNSIANIIEINTCIKKLVLHIKQISDSDFKCIANAIIYNNILEILDFVNVDLLSESDRDNVKYGQCDNVGKYFIESLTNNTSLKHIYGIDVGDMLDSDMIASRCQQKRIKVAN